MGQASYSQSAPSLYGMGPAYDYNYGFMGHNYPPAYGGSSVWLFF